MTQQELDGYKKILLTQRESLVGQISESQRQSFDELASDDMPDPVDMAVHDRDQTVMLSISESERNMTELIDEALTRIEASTYGDCINCGQLIAKARLDAVPYARYDMKCQELFENGELD